MAKKLQKLTTKQELFVTLLLEGKSGADAARESGYGPKSPACSANALMRRPHIQAALLEGRQKLSLRHNVDQNRVVAGLCAIAFGDPGALVDENGMMRQLQDMTGEQRAMLDVETSQSPLGRSLKVRASVSERRQALSELRRILGIGADLQMGVGEGAVTATQVNVHVHINGSP